jgi:dsDNA-specific endonuclease/ATPase MutS2
VHEPCSDPSSLIFRKWFRRSSGRKGDAVADQEPVELPIDGTLDLHVFHPREVKALVPDYLEACIEKGILDVRIVHGKGTGALRETVHAILKRLPCVVEYRLAGGDAGSWGATLVNVRGTVGNAEGEMRNAE